MESKMNIIIENTEEVIAERAKIARSFYQRLKGLMFKNNLLYNEALIILNCDSIHTCFMNFNIDVIFVDKEWKVLRIFDNVKPWRFILKIENAKAVIELQGNMLKDKGINIKQGEKLKIY
jgi:hypothetical protein